MGTSFAEYCSFLITKKLQMYELLAFKLLSTLCIILLNLAMNLKMTPILIRKECEGLLQNVSTQCLLRAFACSLRSFAAFSRCTRHRRVSSLLAKSLATGVISTS